MSEKLRTLYWQLAWGVFLGSIVVRLVYFAGFGVLGDDAADVFLADRPLVEGRLDPATAQHYRLFIVFPRALSFYLFGITPFSFVLPILLYALSCHALALFVSRSLLSERAALLVSCFFLTTPFETLSSTISSPDYGIGFFSFLCAWLFLIGVMSQSRAALVGASFSGFAAVLNKVSGFGIFLILGAASLAAWRHWRRTGIFWLCSLVCLGLICVGDRFYSGHYFRWFWYNNFFDGHDVSNKLLETWARFPRYLFWTDDFGNWMFGFTGYFGLVGAILALHLLLKGDRRPIVLFVAVYWFGMLGIIEFMPHKLSCAGYFSHFRVFRYLATVTPIVYLSAGFMCEHIFQSVQARGPFPSRMLKYIFSVLLLGVFACQAREIPDTTKPSWDSARDGKALLEYLETFGLPRGATVHANQWKCDWIRTMWMERTFDLRLECHMNYPQTQEERFKFFSEIQDAFVITGGSGMGWYGGTDYLLNLGVAKFQPTSNWTLLLEVPGEVTPWRVEPLRLWRVCPLNQITTCEK